MKANFLILAVGNLVVMCVTAVVGLSADGSDLRDRHVLLGLVTGLYTCFVHVITFMYFSVSGNIVKQAVGAGQVEAALHDRVIELKRRALRASATGILGIVVVVFLGGATVAALASWIHMIAAFAAIGLNGAMFAWQYSLIQQNRCLFDAAFGRASPPTMNAKGASDER